MKSALASKTLWFNGLDALLFLFQGVTDLHLVNHDTQLWMTLIGNVILRFISSQSVSLTGKPS